MLVGLLLLKGEELAASLTTVSSVVGEPVCCCLFFFFFLDSLRTPFLRIRRVTALLYPGCNFSAKISTWHKSTLCSTQYSVTASRNVWFYITYILGHFYLVFIIIHGFIAYIPHKPQGRFALDYLPTID